MKILAQIFSITGIVCFFYLMISAYRLRWMIDTNKIKAGDARLFRAITPPKEVLTSLGVKVWWSRWIVLPITIGCFIASYNFWHR